MYTELLRGVRRVFAGLLTLHLIGAFTGIYFLTRAVPRTEASLATSESALVATRELMGALAARHEPFEHRLERWRAAREQLERETPTACTAELPLLRARGHAALDGDPEALSQTLAVLHAAADWHRASAVNTHAELDRRGTAGAWALMCIGTVFTAAVVLMERRTRRNIVVPVADLAAVVQSQLTGNPHRRCHPSSDSRLAPVLAAMNQLLDRLLVRSVASQAGPGLLEEAPVTEVSAAVILHFLAKETTPALLLDARGGLVAGNQLALERLAQGDGDELRDRLRAAARGDDIPDVERREAIGDSGATLFCLVPPAAEEPQPPTAAS